MTPNKCAEFLAKFNLWRRADADDEGSEKVEMPHPRELGLAIDRAVELLNQASDTETLEQESRQVRARLARITAERDELAEKVRLLELAEEGAKEAFGTIVDEKHAAEARGKAMQRTISAQQDVIYSSQTQRFDLLAALDQIASEATRDLGSARIVARAAITKVRP